MPDSLYDRLRDGALRSLQLDPAKLGQEIEQARSPQVNAMLAAAHPHARIHGPIRLDPAQIDQYQRERKPGPTDWRDQPIQLDMEHLGQPSHTLTLNPERTAARWENQPGAFRQGQPLDVPLPPERPRVSNLKLGWQEGLSNLMGTIYGFSDDRRGPRGVVKVGPGGYGLTPTEPTMAEAMKNVVTDQNELEKNLQAQSSGGGYISYVSPTQINVLAPPMAGGTASVQVNNNGAISAARTVGVAGESPAFFELSGNQVIATRTDYTYAAKNGTIPGLTTTPAKPGDVLILWGTGFGASNPVAPAGVVTPSAQTYSASDSVAVTINGVPATVYGVALTPGLAGVYQVAIQVPQSLANGDWQVMATTQDGFSSASGVIVTVQN